VLAINLLNKLEKHWLELISPFGVYDLNGGIAVSCSELNLIQVNHVTHININKNEADQFVQRVESFFESKNIRSAFRITPATQPKEFDKILLEKGFQGPFNSSVMVHKRKQADLTTNPKVIVQLFSPDNISGYIDLWHKISGIPQNQASRWSSFFKAILVPRGHIYLGYIENTPVGCCLHVVAGNVNGLYMVGTLEKFRNRGVATALCAQAIKHSFDTGCKIVTLQTDEGSYAERFFQKLGFHKAYTMSFYQESKNS
jgi:ribosomal protein S18 acetylase RimI-like enzyme